MVPLPFTPAGLRTAPTKAGELLVRKCRRSLNVPLETFVCQVLEGCNPFAAQSSQPPNDCDLEQIQSVGLGLSSTSAAASRSFTDPGEYHHRSDGAQNLEDTKTWIPSRAE
jgi:hypothetical protein